MIEGYGAPPGGGKSLRAVDCIAEELAKGALGGLCVVTNILLELVPLSVEVVRRGGKWDPSKVTILTDKQMGEVWRHVTRPSLIVADEAAGFWPARGFKDDNTELEDFLRLHRHNGHQIIWCAAVPDRVLKLVRDYTEHFVHLRNLGYGVKWGAGWNGRFVYRSTNDAEGRGTPLDVGTFTLDTKRVGSCYRTNQYSSIVGSRADTARKPKRDIRQMTGALLVLAACLVFGAKWALTKVLTSASGAVSGSVAKTGQGEAVAGESSSATLTASSSAMVASRSRSTMYAEPFAAVSLAAYPPQQSNASLDQARASAGPRSLPVGAVGVAYGGAPVPRITGFFRVATNIVRVLWDNGAEEEVPAWRVGRNASGRFLRPPNDGDAFFRAALGQLRD